MPVPLLTLPLSVPPSAVTDAKTTIESVLQEQRVFDPPAEVSAQARIGSLEAYRALADAAKSDPDRFWETLPVASCIGSNRFTPFSTGRMLHSPVGSKGGPPTSPTTALTVISMAPGQRRQH